MATTFNKLKLPKYNEATVTFKFNDQEIKVKQYLPIQEKLKLISAVLSKALDFNTNNFFNPVQLEMLGALEIIYHYTDISFTDKQREEPWKLYDALECAGLVDEIAARIPATEYASVINGINDCAQAVYTYNNSALGLLDNIQRDYADKEFDLSKITADISNPNNLALLKQIMSKG